MRNEIEISHQNKTDFYFKSILFWDNAHHSVEFIARFEEQEPVKRFEEVLLRDGHAEASLLAAMQTELEAEIEAVIETALAAPDPDPEEAFRYVYAEPVES